MNKKLKLFDGLIIRVKASTGAGGRHEYKAGNNSTHGENVYLKYYDRAGIEAANAKNIYQQFASKREMPTKYGKDYTVRRWFRSYTRDINTAEFQKLGFLASRDLADISAGTAALHLSEGADTTTNLTNLKSEVIHTTLNRYGGMLTYTDEADLFSNDNVQVRYREELGSAANLVYEDLIQQDMLSTNTVFYSGAGTSLATMGTGLTADASLDREYMISEKFVRQCVQKLLRNQAEPNNEMVIGSAKLSCKPLPKSYYAIVGPEIAYDLYNLTREVPFENQATAYPHFAFIPVERYASATTIAEGEIGSMHQVRFILSETAAVYRGKGAEVPNNYVGNLSYTGEIGNGAKFDVFPILFPTKDSFGVVGLKGNSKIVFHSKAPKDIEHSNPFGTKGFFSYNFWYAGIILQEEKLLKGLVLATAH